MWIAVVFFTTTAQTHSAVTDSVASHQRLYTAANGNILLSVSSQVIIGAKKDRGVSFNQSNKLLMMLWSQSHQWQFTLDALPFKLK